MDCSLPGSSVHGIFQARVLEWGAIAFSRGSSWPRDWTQVSRIAGGRFTIWATREVLYMNYISINPEKQTNKQTKKTDQAPEHMMWCHKPSSNFWWHKHSQSEIRKKVNSFICVRLFATPWTVAYQAPQSMEFSRRDYWSGLPFSSPGDLPNPGIEPRSPALQAEVLLSEPPGKPYYSAIRWNLK